MEVFRKIKSIYVIKFRNFIFGNVIYSNKNINILGYIY